MKVFLSVPFADRKQAKMNGAHWSPAARKWYVISRTAYRDCLKWTNPPTVEVQQWLAEIEDFNRICAPLNAAFSLHYVTGTLEQQRRASAKQQRQQRKSATPRPSRP